MKSARGLSNAMREAAQVDALFVAVEAALGSPNIVVYNASGRARGPFIDLIPSEVERTLALAPMVAS